ncbi:MAG: GAF domain-containing sensor histidine kinase [Comamonas sp.]
MNDLPESIAHDVAAVGRISAVPSILRIVCDNTGMRFAAVARVTDGTWTACAVEDNIAFGLLPGGQLDVHSTLCKEARAAREPVFFDHASENPRYRDHHTPRTYNIQSYISVPIIRPDGVYFGNLCAIDPSPNLVSDAKTIGMFQNFAELIGRQLALEQRQEETEVALRDSRQAIELRDQFIAVLGHDLRNPLASMRAISETMLRRLDPEMVKYGTRLRANARRMARLIDDVLDLARGRMGMHVNIAPITDLEPRLTEVVAELRDAHAGRSIVENYRCADAVECDLGRVQQLVSNLLGNALAYGDPAQPVSVNAGVDGNWLELSVCNAGTPISPTSLARIFEPYWRPAESKPGGGLGLGLHICAMIVKAHDGTLHVSSSADAGTCFTARLPVRKGVTAVA